MFTLEIPLGNVDAVNDWSPIMYVTRAFASARPLESRNIAKYCEDVPNCFTTSIPLTVDITVTETVAFEEIYFCEPAYETDIVWFPTL